MKLEAVTIQALTADRLLPIIGPERAQRFEDAARAAEEFLAGRSIINVNSTSAGGGVAEMLQVLLAYARGVGVDAQWVVIQGDATFFDITKRLHNSIYGTPGDGGPLGAAEREAYERTLRANADELLALVKPGDIVLLHDPQTAGLAPLIGHAGVNVVWRCHIGADAGNEHTEAGWSFLRPYLDHVEALVFSRAAFAPPWADPARVHVIPPSIDPFSPKNEPIDPAAVHAILGYVGLIEDSTVRSAATFTRHDGSPGRVNRHADILQTGPPPPSDAPLVLQVSRWDRLKDMAGVMTGFAESVGGVTPAHLLLVGPAVTGVADDPEAIEVLDECVAQWRALPHFLRSRVHLACLPMRDRDENAAIVNALQRHATIVTQKSIAEGFGLTVVEAMWKARPVVASAVGGITDQIRSGEHGLLVDDPHDLAAFGQAVLALLQDRALAERLGAQARERAVAEFLGDRHLEQWATLIAGLEPAPAP
jgi:trehalose synthase